MEPNPYPPFLHLAQSSSVCQQPLGATVELAAQLTPSAVCYAVALLGEFSRAVVTLLFLC